MSKEIPHESHEVHLKLSPTQPGLSPGAITANDVTFVVPMAL